MLVKFKNDLSVHVIQSFFLKVGTWTWPFKTDI